MLKELAGKAILARVCEQLSPLKNEHTIIIATDDIRIQKLAKAQRIECIMTRSEHQSGTDRCAEVAAALVDIDIVINVQGDEPFIQASDVQSLITLLMRNDKVQIATLIAEISDAEKISDPNTVKVTKSRSDKALYFSRSAIPSVSSTLHYQHIGVYAFRRNVLMELCKLPMSELEKAERLEQLRWLENDYNIQTVLTKSKYLSIDTPEDLVEAARILEETRA